MDTLELDFRPCIKEYNILTKRKMICARLGSYMLEQSKNTAVLRSVQTYAGSYF